MIVRQSFALVRAAHAPPTVAVTVIVTVLALGSGRGWSTLWATAAVAAGQLSVGWSNDYFDRDLDRASGRRDKPLTAGDLCPRTVWRAALVAVAATVVLSGANGMRAAVVHLTAVAAAWVYNLGLKATVLSAMPYAVAFGLLPAFVSLGGDPAQWPPLWACAAGALLGVGAHFINVVPDLSEDRRHGRLGLPQRLGFERSLVGGSLFVVGATVVLVVGGAVAFAGELLVVNGALALGAVVCGLHERPRWSWYLALVAAVIVAVAFAASGGQLR
ncbi:MAG: UbiA family prenyltransferase [Acidimicrobiia bacterium]